MPLIINNHRYKENTNPDGSIDQIDTQLSIITATISEITHKLEQNDGINTWNRGTLSRITTNISTNAYLTTYLRYKPLPFILTTKLELKEDDVYTFLGHIERHIFKNGAHTLTFKCSTVIKSDFDYTDIQKILQTKKVDSNIITDLISKYQADRVKPIEVIIDIKRGSDSYYLADYTDNQISSIQRAMDTEDDNLAEAIVTTELIPYFGANNAFPKQMYQRFGFDAKAKLIDNPWDLVFDIQRLTFTKCDEIATMLGYDLKTDERRMIALVRLAFKNGMKDTNNTYIPFEQIDDLYNKYLSQHMTKSKFEEYLTAHQKQAVIVKTEIGYQPIDLYCHEQIIYQGVQHLIQTQYSTLSQTNFDIINKEKLAENPDFQFADEQKDAITKSVESGLFILTGGPGTGKTTTLQSILRAHELHFNYPKTDVDNEPIVLLAPTGKAATRMTEQTNRYASTIHKRLLITYNGCRDVNHVINQFKLKGTRLLVIDEASMLDTAITGTIFQILEQADLDIKLIIIGDTDQLPSINEGQILKDLTNYVPSQVHLTKVQRQAADSSIIKLAAYIRNNQFPSREWFKSKDDVFLIEKPDSKQTLDFLAHMLDKRQSYNDLQNFQILTPYVNQSQMAKQTKTIDYDTCDIINHATQEYFNSPYYDPSKPDSQLLEQQLYLGHHNGKPNLNIKRFVNNGKKINGVRQKGRLFRIGDRVVCNTNLTQSIANGTIGTLLQIGTHGSTNKKDWTFLVQFDKNPEPYEFTYQDWHQIDLAYAMTVHKAQGSEYPNVFFVLTRQPRPNDSFLTQNIVYTAVTRAKDMLLLLGKHSDFVRAVANKQPERLTGLAYMFKHQKSI